jgi:uncharacterized FlaG/YvyC family protein
MNEPTTTRGFGPDVTRSGWQAASDRADAPRPDAVRSEAAQAEQPVLKATTPLTEPATGSSTKEIVSDASFARSYARFEINDKTKQLSIKIVDAATDEVIREFPSEQVQRIAEELQVLARRGSIGKRPAEGAQVAGGGVDRYV